MTFGSSAGQVSVGPSSSVAVVIYPAGGPWPSRPVGVDNVIFVSADSASGTPGDMNASTDVALLPSVQQINSQTGATYALLASDANKLVACNRATGVTFTVNDVLATGQVAEVLQVGDGRVTFVAGSGVTLLPTTELITRQKGSRLALQALGSGVYNIFGDLAAS